jgi:hypothetical protein
MTEVPTVSGTVTAVAIGYGIQYPSITIGKIQIKVAPIWYLLDNNFEIKTGDSLSVQAAPSISTSDSYQYAVEITNTISNQRLALRDTLGRPLWTSAPSTAAIRPEGQCLLGSVVAVVSGIVDQINIGVGIQLPTLTMRTAAGALLTFKLGPERVLLESDVELKTGEPATVKYASSTCSNELVALTVTDAAGKTVVLRDDVDRPAWW